MNNILRDKDILVKKYEEKIKYLSNQHLMSQSIDSSTSIKDYLQSGPKAQQDTNAVPPNEKPTKKYPPTPPKTNSYQSQR
jgi:hypothetical protein